ncbi:MAG: transketolase [Desulfuromonadaceae bacterium]|nr:transketolase [Desulfuromonadaceae bacterium]
MSMPPLDPAAARRTVDTLRLLSIDAVEKARSGHPGTPLEAAPIVYLLYRHHLRHNPANPDWAGRDRFILSCGHASALLYSTLHLAGYDLSLDDLKAFRQFGSKTAGHPEFLHTPGVETTTGPLGQGLAVATGMAMGGRFLAESIDAELFDYRIYTVCSDGDLMEGVTAEAGSLAGHLRLGNLIAVYLDNRITIEGATDLAFSEEVATRYLAYGWHVERVEGENLLEIDAALTRARTDPRPSLIIARTHIGQGSPHKQDTAAAHGAPLGADEVALVKKAFGRDPKASFAVPDDVYAHCAAITVNGAALESDWNQLAAQKGLDLASRLNPPVTGLTYPQFSSDAGALATRQASGTTLNQLAGQLPLLLGGSADLGPSNNTALKGLADFSPEQAGRNIHFGIREHAMGAILNGLAHTPGVIPYGGTFLVFADYMKPAIRLAALMGLAPIYVFTHDSIGLGEDGPTHQPIEQLALLRSIPQLHVIRPADANETAVAWRAAIERRDGPTALILSRQGLPTLERNAANSAEQLLNGGYVLAPESGALQVILLATGSEVHPTLAARDLLEAEGIATRVVAVPCWELFAAQPASYRDSVLPPACRLRVAVEAASPFGWERFVGLDGTIIAMNSFGASAPAEKLMTHFGFTPERIAAAARQLLATSAAADARSER